MSAALGEYRYYTVSGGQPLRGEIAVGGAKNAAPKLIIASLLSDEISVLENVPRIGEVDITLSICTSLGARWRWIDNTTLEIDPSQLNEYRIPGGDSLANRSSILFLAPLLARFNAAQICTVGGDAIGAHAGADTRPGAVRAVRAVDFHVDGLRTLGVEVHPGEQETVFAADGLHGGSIRFAFPSVGATEQMLIAAVAAEGRTVLRNAAIEPEIQNLVGFLQAMGATIQQEAGRIWIIDGAGSPRAGASPGSRFRGVRYRVIPDRLEAASYAAAAVATGGDIFVRGAVQEHMPAFLNILRAAGGEFEIDREGIRFTAGAQIAKVILETSPHPGFMTDWLPPLAVLLTQAEAVSIVHETVYEQRFGYVPALVEMGAHIEMHGSCLGNSACRFRDLDYQHSAVIHGQAQLRPSELVVPDLRAGFAYLLAALVAEGESKVWQVHLVERGYSALQEKLGGLGAVIAEGHGYPPPLLADTFAGGVALSARAAPSAT